MTTHFHPGPQALKDWWYIRDKTHVAFYSTNTMRFVAEKYEMELVDSDETHIACFRLI